MRRNIILFVLVIILTVVFAPGFGSLYDYCLRQLAHGSLIATGNDNAVFLVGIPFAYMFLVPFVFKLFGSGNKGKWIIISLAPVLLFYLQAGMRIIYLPLILGLAAYCLAKLIHSTLYVRNQKNKS